MKTAPKPPSPPRHFLEPLEERIAPAIMEGGIATTVAETPILLGDGVDSQGRELPRGLGSDGPYAGGYYLYVEKGQALVFTTDLNGDNIVDPDEITGIAAGSGLRLLSFVDINGDIVTNLNSDGTLVFLHRLKDGYKHNGFNVSTPEVEAVMRSHPAIAAAAVVGIPHDRFGEIGVAFAIAKPRTAPDGDEVLAFLRERLASFKLPAGVLFVDEFPLTAGTEKIQKFKLKQVAIERFGHQAEPSMPTTDQRAGRAVQ